LRRDGLSLRLWWVVQLVLLHGHVACGGGRWLGVDTRRGDVVHLCRVVDDHWWVVGSCWAGCCSADWGFADGQP
jgi:hypothetical protein